jgi:hypothetical protein
MAPQNDETPPGRAGLEHAFPGGNCSSEIPPKTDVAQAKSRLKYLAQRLHAHGPRPLFHFLAEIETGADLRSSFEEYAQLPVDFVKANRGDQFPPAVFPLRKAAHG